jgi:hypothetical protein
MGKALEWHACNVVYLTWLFMTLLFACSDDMPLQKSAVTDSDTPDDNMHHAPLFQCHCCLPLLHTDIAGGPNSTAGRTCTCPAGALYSEKAGCQCRSAALRHDAWNLFFGLCFEPGARLIVCVRPP